MKAQVLVLSIALAVVFAALLAVAFSTMGGGPPGGGDQGGGSDSFLPTPPGTLNYAQQTIVAENKATFAAVETRTVFNDATVEAGERLTRQANPFPTNTPDPAAVSALEATRLAVQEAALVRQQTRQAVLNATATAVALVTRQPDFTRPPTVTPLPTSTPWWNPPTPTLEGRPSPTPPPTRTFAPTATASPPSESPSSDGEVVCNTPWGTFPGSCPPW